MKKLRPQQVDWAQIERFLQSAEKKLASARKILAFDEEACLQQAYEAMLPVKLAQLDDRADFRLAQVVARTLWRHERAQAPREKPASPSLTREHRGASEASLLQRGCGGACIGITSRRFRR